jgi:hypothetical protein
MPQHHCLLLDPTRPCSPRSLRSPLPAATQRLVDRLDAVLTVLAYCSGPVCRQPFSAIHPDGAVANLAEALAPQYDALYASFAKLDFKR